MPSDEQLDARDDRRGKKSRGSTDNTRRLSTLFSNQSERKADWSNAPAGHVLALVCAITALGGAISFGTSRDGGAYSVTLMLGGERETLWFNGTADLEAELDNALYLIQTLG
jgi:hypothetical protein